MDQSLYTGSASTRNPVTGEAVEADAATRGWAAACLRRFRLRWLRHAVWRLAELCVGALSGPLVATAAPDTPAPWRGGAVVVDPYAFAAPFVLAVLLKRMGKGY
uniref:Uncharacterized protein n=1 Tax=Oryza meridionalis TaxID=40149 RepID=A0A0E0DDH3_9ORYZ